MYFQYIFIIIYIYIYNCFFVSFDIFKKLVKSGSRVRCIITKNTKDKPRSFFDNIDKWAKEQGASGLAYFTFEEGISAKGPVGKFFSKEALKEIIKNPQHFALSPLPPSPFP